MFLPCFLSFKPNPPRGIVQSAEALLFGCAWHLRKFNAKWKREKRSETIPTYHVDHGLFVDLAFWISFSEPTFSQVCETELAAVGRFVAPGAVSAFTLCGRSRGGALCQS